MPAPGDGSGTTRPAWGCARPSAGLPASGISTLGMGADGEPVPSVPTPGALGVRSPPDAALGSLDAGWCSGARCGGAGLMGASSLGGAAASIGMSAPGAAASACEERYPAASNEIIFRLISSNPSPTRTGDCICSVIAGSIAFVRGESSYERGCSPGSTRSMVIPGFVTEQHGHAIPSASGSERSATASRKMPCRLPYSATQKSHTYSEQHDMRLIDLK
mmetsp:Transcript_836/g.2206  ORF Transcript_836/g.2206 Transcript_836/m.2206 type:complete len:219 (-) Transcript_836:372-1028(-)